MISDHGCCAQLVSDARAPELGRRVDALIGGIQTAPRLTTLVSLWLDDKIWRVPRTADVRQALNEHDAWLMGLPCGTEVTRREGHLVSASGVRAAAVTALVHTQSLELNNVEQAAFRSGTTPLGHVLGDAKRVTHTVIRIAGVPSPDRPVVKATATLNRAGRTAVLVYESVLWQLITHTAHAILRPARTAS